MKIGIMQPYFLPYLGYFQLIKASDAFVLHDNVQFTKRGWLNRNRILLNGRGHLFTLPLVRTSHKAVIKDKYISADYSRESLLAKIYSAYHKAPHFRYVFPQIEKIILFNDNNFFTYTKNSILEICKMLEIEVNVLEASCCEVPPETSGQERVISICKALKAKAYINPISGTKLYSSTEFYNNSISLNFIQPNLQLYKQYHNKFIPNLSVLDTLMFVDKATIIKMCNNDFTIL